MRICRCRWWLLALNNNLLERSLPSWTLRQRCHDLPNRYSHELSLRIFVLLNSNYIGLHLLRFASGNHFSVDAISFIIPFFCLVRRYVQSSLQIFVCTVDNECFRYETSGHVFWLVACLTS